MKAMILAAGYGLRLNPITKEIPKCMIDLEGKPVIERQINWLKSNGINEIAINLHYLPEKITNYLGNGSSLEVNITYSLEEKLLGTAGAIKKMENFFDNDFLVVYGDEYTNFNIDELKKYHSEKNSTATICIREDPPEIKATNVILIDENYKITDFVEKPSTDQIAKLKLPTLTNCGIYLLNPEVLRFIPKGFADFGYDVFPILVKKKKVYGFIIPEKYDWYELGTLERYEKYKNRFLEIKK